MLSTNELKPLIFTICFLSALSSNAADKDSCTKEVDVIFTKYYVMSQDSTLSEDQRNLNLNLADELVKQRKIQADCVLLNSLPRELKDKDIANPYVININEGKALTELKRSFPILSRSTGDEGLIRDGEIVSASLEKIVIYKKNWYQQEVEYPIQEWIISFKPKDLNKIYYDRSLKALVIESNSSAIQESYWEDENKNSQAAELSGYSILAIQITENNGLILASLLSVISKASR